MGMIKTKKEIKLLKKSAQITDSCIPIIRESLKEDKITEKEIARRIRKNLKKQNATLAFETIVACGKRAAMIHAKPRSTNKKISGIGLVDFGACYKGYRTDMTVPFIKGKISERERKIVVTVLQAYDVAIKSIKVGKYCWKSYEKTDKFLRNHGFRMVHSLGHGIGLKIHELPYIWKTNKKLRGKKKLKWEKIKKIKFQESMIFTIEPAVYVKGLGGCRLENDFLIEKKKIKSLTHANLIEV
jgi:Xaa-Pro aminopeptidase